MAAHNRELPTFADYLRNVSPKGSLGLVVLLFLSLIHPVSGQQLRVLGIDVSTYQGDITTANWSTLRTTDSRDFVIIRSSRGGTTGEDHRQGGYPSGNNTQYYLSCQVAGKTSQGVAGENQPLLR